MQRARAIAKTRRYGHHNGRSRTERDADTGRPYRSYLERRIGAGAPSRASSATPWLGLAGTRETGYPVVSLIDLYTGAECTLPPARDDGTAIRVVACADGSSIALSRGRASERRYSLHISRGRVAIFAEPTSDRETTVNGIPLLPGLGLELTQGAIIRVGDSAMIAVGRPVDPAIEVAVRTADELMLAHLRIHGSMRSAARALGIAKSTFNDRVRRALARRE